MRILLDTHIFLWWDSEPKKLLVQARTLCEDPKNVLVLSVASVCEMQIKQQLGKLQLRLPLSGLIDDQTKANDLQISPVALHHVLAVKSLPPHHKDPFDRLFIAQENAEKLGLLSADAVFKQYAVNFLY